MDKSPLPTLAGVSPAHPLAKNLRHWQGLSKIGTPLGSPILDEAALDPTGFSDLDLDSHLPQAPSLSRACEALAGSLPAGMSLRGLGSHAGDRQAIYDHWMGLGAEGLRTRFFMAPSHWLLRQRAFDLDFENPRFAGIFTELGELACLAEWAREGLEGDTAEAAFSTSPAHRRKGLAKIAAAACALDARDNGIISLRIDTLRENHAAQHLAASLGGSRVASAAANMGDPLSSLIDLTAVGDASIESRMGLASEPTKAPKA